MELNYFATAVESVVDSLSEEEQWKLLFNESAMWVRDVAIV